MDAWKTFYRPYFGSERLLCDFVETCEGLEPTDNRHRAKIMMHQGQRLISLSENTASLEAEKDSLKLFFLIVCAEAVAKLHADYKREGQSKKFIRHFFHAFCTDEEQRALLKGIEICRAKPDIDKVVDALYRVRCDVVHEGRYWGFSFATAKNKTMITGHQGQVMMVTLTYNELKNIVCNGVIRAIGQLSNFRIEESETI